MDIPVLNTPREILITALGKEKEAYHFYKELLRTTRPKLLKELLEQLQDEELKHSKMVEKMISRLDRGWKGIVMDIVAVENLPHMVLNVISSVQALLAIKNLRKIESQNGTNWHDSPCLSPHGDTNLCAVWL